jgi:hypothetical protein
MATNTVQAAPVPPQSQEDAIGATITWLWGQATNLHLGLDPAAQLLVGGTAAGLAIGAGWAFASWMRGRIGRSIHAARNVSPRRRIFAMVGTVALAATILSNKGIQAALHRVGYDGALDKVAAFVMFEMFLAIAAFLSYRQRMRHPGRFDPYRYLVLGLATLMAAASWWGDGSWFAAVPAYIAALAWEIALAAEQAHEHGSSAARTWLARTLLRVVVFLRLYTPTDQDTNELDRQRRITRYVRCVYRLHHAEPGLARWWGLRRPLRETLEERQQRLLDDLDARGLWTPDTEQLVQQRLHRRYTAVELTSPEFVRDLFDHGQLDLQQALTELTPATVEPAPPAPVKQPRPVAVPAPALLAGPAPQGVTEAPRAVNFGTVETAFVDLYVATGRKPGSRAIEHAIKGHPGAPRKTTINEWMRANPETVAKLTAKAVERLAAAQTKESA